MEHQPKKKVIKVTDKRGAASPAGPVQAPPSGGGDLHGRHTEHAAPTEGESDSVSSEPLNTASLLQTPPPPGSSSESEPDYLGDLQRLQAEFDNYRKRVMRDSASAGDRAAARVIENLLPVLDNFERAIAHGEGGEGVQLVFKDLLAALESEGLEEVPADGAAFDPTIHDAIESREVEGLEEPAIVEVYRRGYMHKGQLIRPAMVVVGRPTETDEATE